MSVRRRTVLLGLLFVMGLAGAPLHYCVPDTVFFEATVASVLVPLPRWLRRRGLPRWGASAVATRTASVAGISWLLLIGVVLYLGRAELV